MDPVRVKTMIGVLSVFAMAVACDANIVLMWLWNISPYTSCKERTLLLGPTTTTINMTNNSNHRALMVKTMQPYLLGRRRVDRRS